jgi:hypothetical protein
VINLKFHCPELNEHQIKMIDRLYNEQFEKALGPKEPKVVVRKGHYLPYQPQVEQHKRQGRNLLRAEAQKAWYGK